MNTSFGYVKVLALLWLLVCSGFALGLFTLNSYATLANITQTQWGYADSFTNACFRSIKTTL